MLSPHGNIFVFFVCGFLMVFVSILASKILAPQRPNPQKNTTYECGEEPIGSGWINFNARFYLIAILFVVFDVEIVLVFPVISKYRDFVLSGRGLTAFAEIFIFAAILFLGIVYAWKYRHLEWLDTVRKPLKVHGKLRSVKDIIKEDSL